MTLTHHAPARERILDMAGRLFYQHGFHAVGIDRIIAESDVAKMTLYRHFPSKDALIAAYLERANAQFWAWLDGATATVADPLERLRAICAAVMQLATSPQCLGCTFQASAAEFPALDHPAHRVALAHKQALRAHLHDLAAAAGLRNADGLADQLLLLIDGAWVAARMYGPNNPAAALGAAAEALIAAYRTPGAEAP
jgi:AcrR family transcriptional regulator